LPKRTRNQEDRIPEWKRFFFPKKPANTKDQEPNEDPSLIKRLPVDFEPCRYDELSHPPIYSNKN